MDDLALQSQPSPPGSINMQPEYSIQVQSEQNKTHPAPTHKLASSFYNSALALPEPTGQTREKGDPPPG
jgi:hypothetical protein